MENLQNNSIVSKIDEIIDSIKDSKEYQNYLFLFDKLSKNDRCNSLIKQVKTLQKELVKKQANGQNVNELEEKINKLVSELNTIPLYVEFVDKQHDLNKIYQSIKIRLDNYFNDLFN